MSPQRHKITLAIALIVAFGGLGAVLATDTRPRLGLDLEGGTSVILSASGEGIDDEAVGKTVDIIRERIDGLGVAEPEVTAQGGDTIQVQLPGIEDENAALEVIGTTAQLTFRQVEELIPRDGGELLEEEEEDDETTKDAGKNKGKSDDDSKNENRKGGSKRDSKNEDPKRDSKEDNDDSDNESGPAGDDEDVPDITEAADQSVNDEEVVYPDAEDSNLLYRLAPAELTGDVITSAQAVTEPGSNQWFVSLDMDGEGAETWADFTSELACLRDEGDPLSSQVAIVLDGEVATATGMADPAGSAGGGVECGTGITGGESRIDMGSQEEAKDLALVLRYGSLPITLTQESISKISPSLGRDSLEAGLLAGLLGLALVLIYVVVYYRALGFVVWGGLVVFAALSYMVIALLGAGAGLSLSLAGIAGFIVSIGVTTDSYIVVFERLKDEIGSGRSIRSAIDRGTKRALRTILVADFVTGSAAVILFFLAVGPVKGFALTLGLATLIDVFVAFCFTRPVISLLRKTGVFESEGFMGIKSTVGAQT
ncbi:MAG: protein translocase subunit SecD [Actinomycetota bacterium]|nr:protein translocase subunit SecD [Actinomycetota bacterium]